MCGNLSYLLLHLVPLKFFLYVKESSYVQYSQSYSAQMLNKMIEVFVVGFGFPSRKWKANTYKQTHLLWMKLQQHVS